MQAPVDLDLNVGLKDQLEALQWINREIENWGGDPNKVCACAQHVDLSADPLLGAGYPRRAQRWSHLGRLAPDLLSAWTLPRRWVFPISVTGQASADSLSLPAFMLSGAPTSLVFAFSTRSFLR